MTRLLIAAAFPPRRVARRAVAVFGLAAICGAPVLAQDREGGQPVRRITIDAVAIDRDNNPITDLKTEEMEVWIGGFRVPIEAFEAITPGSGGDDGRLIVLLLDDMMLPLQLVPRVREAAKRFVNRMGPDDRMAVVMLNGGVMESTSDRAKLFRSIDAYNVRPSGVMRIDILGAHIFRTVEALGRRLAEAPGRRGAIVAIGVSWIFDRPIATPAISRDLRPEWTAAMRAMAIARANLYVIEPAGVGMSPVGGGAGGFAHATGGHAFLNTNDLTGVADRIMRETGNYYLIAVADPPAQRKAELRELEVRVLRRGVTVRAREFLAGHQ